MALLPCSYIFMLSPQWMNCLERLGGVALLVDVALLEWVLLGVDFEISRPSLFLSVSATRGSGYKAPSYLSSAMLACCPAPHHDDSGLTLLKYKQALN